MNLKELITHLKYDPASGDIFILKNSKPTRKLIPDEFGKIETTVLGKRLAMKADRLIWFIVYGKQPTRKQVVFHKNLNEADNRINNLSLLSKKDHQQIIEAMKNISGTLRLIPHATDAFSYVLQYKLNGRARSEVICDITVARRKLVKLQLKFVKIISKFTISE